MSKFVTFDPTGKVLGSGGIGYYRAIEELGFDPVAVFERNGFTLPLDPDGWYDVQMVLNLLQDVEENLHNFYSLITIGNKVNDVFPPPPELDSIEKALGSFNIFYQSVHRGEVGFHETEFVNPTHIRVTSYTPYPRNLLYGMFYGIARYYLPKGTTITIYQSDSPKGEDYYVHDVTWKLPLLRR